MTALRGIVRRPSLAADTRRGVLLLVVLSMLTLFMLLGVTYLIFASRVRTTSRAFLRIADDQAKTTVTFRSFLRDAALQVIRGTDSTRSAIRYHDLLGDKYGSSRRCNTDEREIVAGGQLLRLRIPNLDTAAQLVGRVITFIDAPTGVEGTSTRIAAAENAVGGIDIWMVRPAKATAGNIGDIRTVLVNGRDFGGHGFSTLPASGRGMASLDDSSLTPNQAVSPPIDPDSPLDPPPLMPDQANEDYDAIDEQNVALAAVDGDVRSFERRDLVKYWMREFGRRTTAATEADAARQLLELAILKPPETPTGDVNYREMLNIRRATLRPFAFDHYQDQRDGYDFTGRRLDSLGVLVDHPGDVDTDGDGALDSVWLDLGSAVTLMPDRKYVKPLFAIRCIDLGGRVSLNAHGSPMHAPSFDPRSVAGFAPRRNSDGTRQSPQQLKRGLGFGPADVRLDAALDPKNMAAVMFGSNAAGGAAMGIRRDVGAIVGRYGDRVGSVEDLPRAGQPGEREWPVSGVPDDFASQGGRPSRFLGSPPDFWSRLAVGIDHRGHPLYANVAPALDVQETTDNPYELDLYAPRPGNGYAQPASPAANVDQPFTAAELETLVRPFDLDNAAALPPRVLALSLAGKQDALANNAGRVTVDTWDTPAVIPNDGVSIAPGTHDADLVNGLKMELNRPFGDGEDSDGDEIADEPGEINDPYARTFTARDGTTKKWLLTGGQTLGVSQPGPDEPHLRARQLFAWHLFNLVDGLRSLFAGADGKDPGFRLFGVKADQDDDNVSTDRALKPVAVDGKLNKPEDPNAGSFVGAQEPHNQRVLAQWAVNVVDFLDADAIMTPFRYAPGNDDTNVVWGCEHPDVMITETLAFHDRRTADTPCDVSGETTDDFRAEYAEKYDRWMAWSNSGGVTTEPPYPNVTDSDSDDGDRDDSNFDQVRIPEGSLFLELHGLRSPTAPHLPRELYSFDDVRGTWRLDLGRVPTGSKAPVWRLAISSRRSRRVPGDPPAADVFKRIADNPDTEWLMPTSVPDMIGTHISIDRYVWFSANGAVLPPNGATGDTLKAAGNGPTRHNTFYLRDTSLSATLRPGGYLVVGPRPVTHVGSVEDGSGDQKWGVPAKQRIQLSPSVTVYGLDGSINPTVAKPNDARFGNPLPPPASRPETSAVWVAMAPPQAWTATWDTSWTGVGTSGIGLNVSEPLADDYYPCPTYRNPATGLRDAYGPLDDDTHTSFPTLPVDRLGGPLTEWMLSGGSYANFCTVFVERLADPTKGFESDPTSPAWNPYIVVDFMPIDLTVFNGESRHSDPEETQGEDRGLGAALPVAQVPTPGPPVSPDKVPLPQSVPTLEARHVYFHSRQRGFGSDLPGYDNDKTLFGLGEAAKPVSRNLHPFKPLGSLADVGDTPLRRTTVDPTVDFTDPTKYRLPGGRPTVARDAASLPAESRAYFLHELGQSPAGRTTPAEWQQIPYHSLGWVNPSFGRRLDEADGVPRSYAGAPDRPFPWLVWNDRPFANPYELIHVPRTPPTRLLTNFRNLDYPAGLEADGVTRKYGNVQASSGSYHAADMFAACTPGAHLLPITSITDVPAPGSTRSRHADVLVRLFEYVRVASPFRGSETILAGVGEDGCPDRFVGPFNRVSKYREPGRINVNTIDRTDDPADPARFQAVWNAICGVASGTATPSFSVIAASGTITLPYDTGNATFRRPFRTASGIRTTDFTGTNDPEGPANTMFATGWLTNPVVAGGGSWFIARGGTMPDIGDRFSVRSFTLLGDRPRTGTGPREPLFAPPPNDAWANDGERNGWFRFETLVRANANTTVRSEVYAIWVTMGLFEVQGGQSPPWVYPDGYRLVREYGSDTGNVTRHRAFYIFDRSVPIGFERGVDHNVQDGLLIERFIE